MTLTLFVATLVLLAIAVSLITEAVKKFLDKIEAKYSSNIVVLIVALIVGVVGTALIYVFLGIPFTPPNIICIVLMAISIWVGAMIGYDKVIQMIEQVRSLKLR